MELLCDIDHAFLHFSGRVHHEGDPVAGELYVHTAGNVAKHVTRSVFHLLELGPLTSRIGVGCNLHCLDNRDDEISHAKLHVEKRKLMRQFVRIIRVAEQQSPHEVLTIDRLARVHLQLE